MRILVTHLTRMSGDKICVAGLTNQGEHVRPIPAETVLTRSHLLASGGLFDVGAVVELGETENVGMRPELEDRIFMLEEAKHEFTLEPDVYWNFLTRHLKPDLKSIFGPDLVQVRQTMAAPVGKGEASLGALQPRSAPRLLLDNRGRIRVQITNEGAKLSVAVTDIRLYDPATLAPREAALHWLNQAVLEGCVLTVGVGRPYQDPEGPDPEHWLQVNNIHPASDPLWRTCP